MEGQVIARVGLREEIGDDQVVQRAREGMLAKSKEGEVLHAYVDEHLDPRVHIVVLHDLDGVVSNSLLGRPSMMPNMQLAPPAPPTHLVERGVEGIEEEVVEKDAEARLQRHPSKRRHRPHRGLRPKEEHTEFQVQEKLDRG